MRGCSCRIYLREKKESETSRDYRDLRTHGNTAFSCFQLIKITIIITIIMNALWWGYSCLSRNSEQTTKPRAYKIFNRSLRAPYTGNVDGMNERADKFSNNKHLWGIDEQWTLADCIFFIIILDIITSCHQCVTFSNTCDSLRKSQTMKSKFIRSYGILVP